MPDNSTSNISRGDIILQAALTLIFLFCTVYIIFLIYHAWPVNKDDLETYVRYWPWSDTTYLVTQEQDFLLLTMMGGALGAMLHILISYSAFVGNRKFVKSWIPWYILRPFVGASLALIFYFLLRGGLLTYSASADASIPALDSINQKLTELQEQNIAAAPPADTTATAANAVTNSDSAAGEDTAGNNTIIEEPTEKNQKVPLPLNPFGLMAVACLAGMFSKQASSKLEDVFNTMFTKAEKHKDRLEEGQGANPANNNNGQDNQESNGNTADNDINDVLPDADTTDDAADDNTPKG